jgi:hypothetical protein
VFDEKSFENRPLPIFRFGESSEILQWMKVALLKGYSLQISPEEHPASLFFSVSMFDPLRAYQELLAYTHGGDSFFGVYVYAHQSAMSLSVDNFATKILNETLDAGFPVYLLAETTDHGGVAGQFTLIAQISDNS